MTSRLALGLTLLVVLAPTNVRAGEVEDGLRVKAAVVHLRDEVWGDCIATMSVVGVVERNGAVVGRDTGTLVFARNGACVLSDTAVAHSQQISARDGRPRKDSNTRIQFFMANGRRCIGINYEPTKNGRRVVGLSCDPRRSYDDSFQALTRYVHLNHLVSWFGPTGSTLVELTGVPPGSVRTGKGGAVTGVYPTVYGVLEVTVDRVGGRDVVLNVRLTQAATDVYTSLFDGGKLADVRESVLGETPAGLTSAVTAFSFDYGRAGGSLPFSSLTVSAGSAAKGIEWRATHTLRLTEYQKCRSQEKIEALRIPIPEGETVDSLDPEYQSIALAYRGGEVVRAVDGASLDEVAADRRFRHTAMYVALALAAAALLACLVWLYARRRARRAGST